jgi:hypothetical protein
MVADDKGNENMFNDNGTFVDERSLVHLMTNGRLGDAENSC